MVKLKRLKIHHYRNIRPGTELHFDNGINLVLGQNGAGKTTLLALISYVASSDFVRLEDEAFSLEYDLSDDHHTLDVTIENLPDAAVEHFKPTYPTSDPFIEAPARTGYQYRYHAEVRSPYSGEHATIDGDSTRTHISRDDGSGPVDHFVEPLSPFRRGFLFSAADPYRMQGPHPGNALGNLLVSFPGRFDESLDCFSLMTGREPLVKGAALPPVAELDVTVSGTPRRVVRVSRSFASSVFAWLVPAAHAAVGGELRIDISGAPSSVIRISELEFLLKTAEMIGARSVSWKPEIRSVREDGADASQSQRFTVRGFSFTFTRHDGTTLHHDLLSYGQKRLLAYFYYIACNPSVVIADELVNGLHHKWIEGCMDAIGDRQAFLTSQNPLLFEYVDFKSIEQVQSCFITCKTEIVDGAEQLVWQNMPRPDAISFFESYQADIESVGDILMTRGLW